MSRITMSWTAEDAWKHAMQARDEEKTKRELHRAKAREELMPYIDKALVDIQARIRDAADKGEMWLYIDLWECIPDTIPLVRIYGGMLAAEFLKEEIENKGFKVEKASYRDRRNLYDVIDWKKQKSEGTS